MAELITIPYAPRSQQLIIHGALDSHRWVVAVCHRRLGKTVAAINALVKAALTCKRERPRFALIGPTYRQAKATAWDYLRKYSDVVPHREVNATELRVDYPNG